MTTDYSHLLRAAYKEFHHGNAYYKGKGREFNVWLSEHHPAAFAVHFERAEGGRQDLDYDAAVPLYIMRPYIIEYLHSVVFSADHSNVLEDFLYTSFRSQQFIAMTRANAVIDLAISRPLRWLAGNSFKLDKWSPASMGRALDLVEQLFTKASVDGKVLLDPTLDVFKEIADEQPLFAAWRKHMYEEHTVVGPDGKTKHLAYKLAHDEIFSPVDPTNAAALVQQKTIEYLEVQCVAGLRKMHDPKLALSNKLTSQEGSSSFGKSAEVHEDTQGLDATNDRLAESVFGVYDYVLKRFPNISMEAASAVAMAMRSKSFSKGGYFHSLPPHEQEALVEVARCSVREMRKVDHADHADHDAYVTAKRKSNSQLELDALVKQYGLALSFFTKWKSRGVADMYKMQEALDAIDTKEVSDAKKATQAKLNYLREQIDMRVVGLGFVEFKTPWSSSTDETVGTVDHLKELLTEILWDERARQVDGDLPEAAVVPIMKRKQFKQLGDPTVQAGALASTVKELSPEELLELAKQKRTELEEAGEIDAVGDEQPEDSPKLDESMVGTKLEVCWRYWRKPTDQEKAAGENRKKIGVKIWCEGEVVQVANGTTDRASPRCKNLLKAGALRIRWPEDKERDEDESFTWSIFQDADWNQDAHLGWRFTKEELAKRAAAAAAARPPPKRRK